MYGTRTRRATIAISVAMQYSRMMLAVGDNTVLVGRRCEASCFLAQCQAAYHGATRHQPTSADERQLRQCYVEQPWHSGHAKMRRNGDGGGDAHQGASPHQELAEPFHRTSERVCTPGG